MKIKGMTVVDMTNRILRETLLECPTIEDSPMKEPFTFEKLSGNITFIIFKDFYYKFAEKHSLRCHRGNDTDDERMLESRGMKYVQKFRDIQYKELKEKGMDEKELLPKDVSTMKGKIQGYELTDTQYFELRNIVEFPLFKAMASKRICDVKKISNTQFKAYMEEYDKLVSNLIEKLNGDDQDIIFASIRLFTLEWKFNIELFYACTLEMEEKQIKEIIPHRLGLLCANLSIPYAPIHHLIHTHSRFLLGRKELLPYLFTSNEEVWTRVESKISTYLVASYLIRKDRLPRDTYLYNYYANISQAEWADFLRTQYNMKKLYAKKEWTNSRIRIFRNICNTMIK